MISMCCVFSLSTSPDPAGLTLTHNIYSFFLIKKLEYVVSSLFSISLSLTPCFILAIGAHHEKIKKISAMDKKSQIFVVYHSLKSFVVFFYSFSMLKKEKISFLFFIQLHNAHTAYNSVSKNQNRMLTCL